MAQVKVTNVQYPMVWNTEITKEDVGQEVVVDVQPGFILTTLAVTVRTAFNGTAPSYSVTDNKVPPNPLIPTKDATLVETNAVLPALLYVEYPSGGKIRIQFFGTGVTVGRADVLVHGIVRGRQNERVGANIAT